MFAKTAQDSGRFYTSHIITSAVEHPATLQPCEFLARLGCQVTVVPVDRHGLVDPDAVRTAIDSGDDARQHHARQQRGRHSAADPGDRQDRQGERGVLMHTDAAQSLGKVPVDVDELGVDLLTVAGHKLYAPKGVGVLYVRRGVTLEPLIHGAGHEGGRRAGTENVPYIVGLGKACDIARQVAARYHGKSDNAARSLVAAAARGTGRDVSFSTAIPSGGCRTRST